MRAQQPNPSDPKKFWCKVYQTKHEVVAAICDEDVLGRTLEDEKFKLTVNRSFYGGLLIGERVALKIMQKVTIGNLMGEHIVEVALRGGFITRENLIFIDGVPHAQFAKLNQR
ncbi:MAG: DUF424 family protein [Candidatus Aenigmarchaeota archaeon]|nr:DUF424 family protein [Candidatus Aenigmarchaeota archaeon]